jgi:hypothetical protein
VENGNRSRRPQIMGLLLYLLSDIRMDAEGPDYRRHSVLERSRASKVVGTSTNSDHRLFTSSFNRIIHPCVVVKKNFVNIRRAISA